ncbi:MAG: xylulokinase [Candidatus Kaistia colombiensis]|nr:MAG: xylulokinase [Kaistia sp.]
MTTTLLGIDLGAGSLKVTVVDDKGAALGSAASSIRTSAPHPGWSEQNPADWWDAVCSATPRALAAAGVDAGTVAGISFSAGAHTSVLVDAASDIIRPAILWNDQRSAVECVDLRAAADQVIRALSANPVSPTWTLPQLYWLTRHEPEAVSRVRRLYLAKDWLRGMMTDDWCTDPVDALGTMMFDASAKRWSPELCQLINWPIHTLPPIRPSSAVTGRVTARAARATGLREGTPVICGTSDTAAEAMGAGMLTPGTGVIKLATAATLSTVTAAPSPDQKLISYYYFPEGAWYLITGTNSCASAHAWLRQAAFSSGGGDAAGFEAMDALAATAPVGSEGLFFHPYLNGERSPYWDPNLRADFVGLSFAHGPAHMARAFYEGIAFSLKDCKQAFDDSGNGFTRARITGGGSRSALWRSIVADALNVTIELPASADASYGAAMVAGLGAGVFADVEALSRAVQVVDITVPDPARHALYARRFEIYRDIQAALAPINHRIVAELAASRR